MPKTLKMKVDNTGFLVDRMGKDCAPLQYLRELTQNAIEAITRTGRPNGMIIWEADSDWEVPKLSITDNGDGMTGEEMLRYINTLSSSGSRQGIDANYGVGAKIAAATRNPAGLMYMSWKDGRTGEAIQLVRDGSGQYGLRSWEDDGDFDYVASVPDDSKHEIVTEAGSGTRIVLLGETAEHDTTAPPLDSGSSAAQWVRRYLNTRYFRIPKNIQIKCQDYSRTGESGRRPVTGQGPMLDATALAKGRLELEDATVHWWILPKGDARLEKGVNLPGVGKTATSMQTFGPGYQNRGHVAYLWRDELYDLVSGNAAYARMHQCGIMFGGDSIVLYVEPTSSDVITNTARTQLIVDGAPPPWLDWAKEFRQAMPAELSEFIATFEERQPRQDTTAIRQRIKEVMQLFPVPKYAPRRTGPLELDDAPDSTGFGPEKPHGDPRRGPGNPRPPQPRPRGGHGLKPRGRPGSSREHGDVPQAHWKFTENGTRAPREMEDKAASFDPVTNVVRINGDFRGFIAWVDYFAAQYPSVPGVRQTIRDQVMQWWEQALLEAVIAHQDYKHSPHWEQQELSDEALTMSVLPRYHIYNALKRGIRTLLGKPEIEQAGPPTVGPPTDM